MGGGGIYSLVWSPDGRTIATYATGDSIQLWDADTRQPLGTIFDGHADVGFALNATLAFSADGRTLFSATPDGVVRAHLLDAGPAATAVCGRARGPLSPRRVERVHRRGRVLRHVRVGRRRIRGSAGRVAGRAFMIKLTQDEARCSLLAQPCDRHCGV
ncbi:WD40 repeat domain-containing protein [Nonomuraea muscovyensis]|uniref:WD40 repeat domain-containing protein n=1 Tax=Nonomuraea muscovyensis TaxID=1124761 RepID=UPI003F4D32DC